MSETTAVRGQGQVSNRSLIEQMRLWGWRIRKVSGEYTLMDGPAGKITVSSSGRHPGNHPETFREMLRLLSEEQGHRVSWEKFISRTEPLYPEDEPVQVRHTPTPAMMPAHRPVAAPTPVAVPEPEPEPTPTPESEQPMAVQTIIEPTRSTSGAGISEALRRAFADGQEHSIYDLAETIGYDTTMIAVTCSRLVNQGELVRTSKAHYQVPTASNVVALGQDVISVAPAGARGVGVRAAVLEILAKDGRVRSIDSLTRDTDFSRKQVRRACAGLVFAGVIERVRDGVYRAKPQYLRHMPESGPIAAQPVVPAAPLPPAPGPSRLLVGADDSSIGSWASILSEGFPPVGSGPTVVSTTPAQTSREGVEETLNEVLDLLFPDGLGSASVTRVLALIDEWKRTTRTLIAEVQGR